MTNPTRCCFNCIYGMRVAGNSIYATQFNKERRMCSINYRHPTYPMYQERQCRGFERKPTLEDLNEVYYGN